MSSWYGLRGPVKRWASASGTFTAAPGTRILQIGFSGGTCQVPTGDGTSTQTLPGVANMWTIIQENHTEFIMGTLGGTGAQLQIVFGSTASAYVEYIGPPGSS